MGGCAPQSGGRFGENHNFYVELNGEWDVHSAENMCFGDLNETHG